jgi:hypothetical protein
MWSIHEKRSACGIGHSPHDAGTPLLPHRLQQDLHHRNFAIVDSRERARYANQWIRIEATEGPQWEHELLLQTKVDDYGLRRCVPRLPQPASRGIQDDAREMSAELVADATLILRGAHELHADAIRCPKKFKAQRPWEHGQ